MTDTDGKSQTQGPWANEAEAISVFEKVRLTGRMSVISTDVAGRAEIQRQANIVPLVLWLMSQWHNYREDENRMERPQD